jgi:hypothetical protein
MSRVVRALALLAVSASALSAQMQPKSFAVITRVGRVHTRTGREPQLGWPHRP